MVYENNFVIFKWYISFFGASKRIIYKNYYKPVKTQFNYLIQEESKADLVSPEALQVFSSPLLNQDHYLRNFFSLIGPEPKIKLVNNDTGGIFFTSTSIS
jgi:hypothetical protein